MAPPIDVHERIRLHVEELGASYSVDEASGTLLVPLGDAGAARLEFADIEWDTLVLFSTTLLQNVDVKPVDAMPLAQWTAELRGAKLCLDPHAGLVTAQTELLGSFADPPEVGFALAALHHALELTPRALDVIGGRAPAAAAEGTNDPDAWWPTDELDPGAALDRVRAMLQADDIKPVDDSEGTLTFLTDRGLCIFVLPSADGNFLELSAPLAMDVDPAHPAVAETLATNHRIVFGGLSVIPGNRTVVVEHDLLMTSLDPQEFFAALDSIAAVADGLCDSIAAALHGRPATITQVDVDSSSGWGLRSETSTGGTASGLRITTGEYVGDYEIEDELGSGAFGTVYRAKDPRLPRSVALKVLKPQWVFDAVVRERFLREARLAARVNHPHLVKVHDVGESGSFVFVAYDLVDGDSLDRVLEDAGALEAGRVATLVWQIGGALQALHDEGFVHRDIKPANVMLWRPGSPWEAAIVLDLGVAYGYETPDATRLTCSAPGTPYYQGPEAEYGTTDDPRLDQYALAATAFELFTGTGVFDSPDSSYELLQRKHAPALESLDDYGIDLPEVQEVLRRALDPDPDARFPTIEDFAEALDAAVPAMPAREPAAPRTPTGKGPTSSPPATPPRLAPYEAWQVEDVPDPLTAPPRELGRPLLRIVETEGPVVAERAFRLMLQGSGRRQLSSGIEKRLAATVRRLVRDGLIEAEQEWGGRKARNAVLRLVSQGLAHPRELGPRRIDEVPPRELAATAAIAVGGPRSEISDDVIRAVLAMYGRERASQTFLDQLEIALNRYGSDASMT